jgi:two-component system, response regulator YesN
VWKVAIVDDELLVRQGLISTIPWDRYGLEVVADFPNGLKALEAMDQVKPDVIITDIRMPKMDGLQLIKEIRVRYPSVITVILSCHIDFEYAREALSLGAIDYLVKTTMDDGEVDRTLTKVQEKLAELQKVGALKRKVEQSEILEKQNDLQAILAGSEDADAEGQSSQYAWKQEGIYLLMVARPMEERARLQLHVISQQLQQRFGQEKEFECTVVFEDYSLLLLRSISGGSFMDTQRLCHLWSNRILGLFNLKKEKLFIGVSRHFANVTQAKQALHEAKSGMEAFFHDGTGKLFNPFQQSSSVVSYSASELFSGEERKRLFEAVANQSVNRAAKLIEEQMEKWTPDVPSSAIKEIAGAIADIIRSNRKQHDLSLSSSKEFQLVFKLSEMKLLVLEELEAWSKELIHHPEYAITRPEIRNAVIYIHKHLHEDPKMNSVADVVHLSRSHFSALFKQETGKTFLEYVMEQKIEQAKRLLKLSEKKLYEIAYEAGFSDYKYFVRCFKDYCGVTPKEWREQAVQRESTSDHPGFGGEPS